VPLKPLSSLAIGSVPFADTAQALELMHKSLDIPAVPQMVALSPFEDMILGAADGLPAIEVDAQARSLRLVSEGREESLADFYQRLYSEDYSFLAPSRRASGGLSAFLAYASEHRGFGPEYLKAQVVGPLTFGQSVKGLDGGALANDGGLLEAISAGLGAKAAYLAERIRELGRKAIVFLDEPGLTGYGSAFSTLSEETVLSALGQAAQTARSKGPVLLGCHVCGNTDWGLLARSGLDIINCDAWGFLDSVVLYPRELSVFLSEGGYIAWGIAPTQAYQTGLKPEILARRLMEGWKALAAKGIPLELIKERALITTSCGLGSLSVETALSVTALLPPLAGLLS
jgi:hypothetical protein